MSRTARTTEFLKDCMADALIKLLSEKPIEKITVRDIVSLAGVGRTTWFRCFSSKHEAVVYRLTRLWTAWATTGGREATDCPPIDAYRDFLAYNYRIRKFLFALYDAGLKSAVYDATENLLREGETDGAEKYVARMAAGALFGVLDEWIGGGMKESPDTLAAATRAALPHIK